MPAAYRSIVGRRLGLTSTGGIGGYIDSTGGQSTAITMLAVMRDSTGARLSPLYEPIVAVSSSLATITNSGVTTISSGSATALTFTVAAPVAGVGKEIYGQTSATTVTLQTSATTILFYDTTNTIDGSTGLVLTTASTDGGNYGAAVLLRGLSTTRWQVVSKPKSSTAAV